MDKNQRGFTLVEGLLLVVVILLIGLSGYFVWNNHHIKTGTTKNKISSVSSTGKNYCSNDVTVNGATSTFTPNGEPSLSFEFPSSWKVTDPGHQYNICQLTSPDGAVNLLWQSEVSGLGGSCGSPPSNLQVTINSSSPIQNASGLSVINFSYTGYTGVAVVQTSSNFTTLGPTNYCSNLFYPSFTSLNDSKDILDIQAVMSSSISNQDLQSVTAILQSIKY